MLHLVRSVHRQPAQRPLLGLRVVIDDSATPVIGAQPGQHIVEKQCGIAELARDVAGPPRIATTSATCSRMARPAAAA
jgi:hypothetical protein